MDDDVNKEQLDWIIREQTERFYSEMLGLVEKGLHDLQVDPRTCAMADIMKKHVPLDARILDAGAGLGDLLGALREAGFNNLEGIDFSKVAAEYSQKIFGGAIKLYNRDLTHPGELEGLDPYDAVILGDTLEHIWAPKRILLNIRKILAAGGLLLVSVPNAGFIVNGLILSFFPKMTHVSVHFGSWTHVNAYTKYLLKEHLKSCGYEPMFVTGSPTRIVFPKPAGFKKKLQRLFILSLLNLAELLRPLSARLFSQNLIVLARKTSDEEISVDPF